MAERKPASSITLPTAIDFDTAELALLISEGVRNVQIRYMRNERRQSASGPVSAGLQSAPSAVMASEFVLQNHALAFVSTPQPVTLDARGDRQITSLHRITDLNTR